MKKFEDFCERPNTMQVIKIDFISEGLRDYFLDSVSTQTTPRTVDKLFIVSFKKIINLFPNVEQIHYFNLYPFDNDALRKLIDQIKKPENRLKQIKFLYYDYSDPLSEYPFFFDPTKLDRKLLDKLIRLKWCIKYPEEHNGRNGYRITVRRINL